MSRENKILLKNKAQLLLEIIISIVILLILATAIFIIFSIIPQAIKYSEDSLIVYNLSNNYLNILNGLSRANFSLFDLLSLDTNYYLQPNTSSYQIQPGREEITYRNEKYFLWFTIKEPAFENDPSKKLIEIYVQTPNFLYKTPLIITSFYEKVLFQDEWSEATTSVIDLKTATSIKYYSTSSNVKTNDEIFLP